MTIEPGPAVPEMETDTAPIVRSRALRTVDWVAIAILALVIAHALTVDIGMTWAKSGGPFDTFSALDNLLPVTAIAGMVVGVVALAGRPPGAPKWPGVLAIILSPIVAIVGYFMAFAIVWSGLQ